MDNDKIYSDEMLQKYISSEIGIIKKKKENPEEWKINKEFHSQITIRTEGGGDNV